MYFHVAAAAPVVSARGLGVWRGDDGAGAADVEVGLVVGEHDGVLLLSEPGPRRLPVELLAQVPRGGHIVGEETPGSVLRKKKKITFIDTIIINIINTFSVAGTQQQPAAMQLAWSGAQSHLSILSTWQCSTVQYSAVHYIVLQYSAVQQSTVQCITV